MASFISCASATRWPSARQPNRSWILCRCSISRSRRRGASARSSWTSSSACEPTVRPFGVDRFLMRIGLLGRGRSVILWPCYHAAAPRGGGRGNTRLARTDAVPAWTAIDPAVPEQLMRSALFASLLGSRAMKRCCVLIALLITSFAWACKARKDLHVATTTSVEASGLLDRIVPAFEKNASLHLR